MGKTLGFQDIDRKAVNKGYSYLHNYLQNVDEKLELNVANSIWVREGQKINENFLSNNKNNFNAQITTLDFTQDSAVQTMNKWIYDATRGKIAKMLEPPIDPDVIMYLINAIYFKGEWSKQFDPEKTFDGTFSAFDGSEQAVKMMSLKGEVEYTEGRDYKAVRLPYGNGKMSMYAILPNEDVSINDFIDSMELDKWNEIRNNMVDTADVLLQIPKFELEYGIKNLNSSLIELGMGEAFSEDADFSGIREDVFISNVFHKAVIEVNEEGSEAAAATVIGIGLTSAIIDPITFIADRPFMFIIADETTGTMLFMGKLLSIK
jgi:serine protease inhibitor